MAKLSFSDTGANCGGERRVADPVAPALDDDDLAADASASRTRYVRGFASAAARSAGRLFRAAAHAALPPTCPVSGALLAEDHTVSPEAWRDLRFIDDPVCARCAAPFETDLGAGAVCAGCAADPPAFDRARAAVLYAGAAVRLVNAFKHGDRTDLAPLFGRWLCVAAAPLLADPPAGFVEPVLCATPLHRSRLASRRYNQAALVAQETARRLGVRDEPFWFERTRATPPQQTQISIEARRRNVAGAFVVRPSAREAVRGAWVILVDDVYTTGATLSACARAARRAGAAHVDALVLARVVSNEQDAI